MTRKQLAKKLLISSYAVNSLFWNEVEVEVLLRIINNLEKRIKNLIKENL